MSETDAEWVARIEGYFEGDPPDGWMIRHTRIVGSTCNFGPFATLADAVAWREAHPEVEGGFTPLYLDVDWTR